MVITVETPIQIPDGENTVTKEVICENMDEDMNVNSVELISDPR